MQLGEVLRRFQSRDGREIILRTPNYDDLDGLMELINSLVDEKAEITRTEKVTKEEELKWFPNMLADLVKDKHFFLVAQANKGLVASSDIRIQSGNAKHVGELGIVVKNGFRNLGIGTEIMKILVEQAISLGLKVLTLDVFATNKRAIHVYEKIGFIVTGKIPRKHFREGQYIDEVIMTKLIE